MDDDCAFTDGPLTSVRLEYGDLAITVDMRQNLSPDYCDDLMLKGRRQLVAAARQLGLGKTPEPANDGDA